MKLKTLSAFAAIALLAACESTPETTGGATGAGAGPRPGSQEDLVASAGDRVFFDFDSAALRPDARSTLDRQGQWMATNGAVRVMIEGHTDDRGTREYNLALGQRRANAARDYLLARGVAGARMTTISYGLDRPAAVGANEQAWAQNRRAVTVVQ